MKPDTFVIILPNLLLNPLYVEGLDRLLLTIADTLDVQGRYESAKSLRDAANICDAFSKINIRKTHRLV